MNTHMDHESELARQKGAEIIRFKVKELRQKFPLDLILVLGDFNCAPGHPAHRTLVENGVVNDAWTDSKKTNRAPITFHHWWGHHVLSPLGSFGTAAFFVYWTGGYFPTHFNRYHIDWILYNGTDYRPTVSLVATEKFSRVDGTGPIYASGARGIVKHCFDPPLTAQSIFQITFRSWHALPGLRNNEVHQK